MPQTAETQTLCRNVYLFVFECSKLSRLYYINLSVLFLMLFISIIAVSKLDSKKTNVLKSNPIGLEEGSLRGFPWRWRLSLPDRS
jgi:hypothetical protein